MRLSLCRAHASTQPAMPRSACVRLLPAMVSASIRLASAPTSMALFATCVASRRCILSTKRRARSTRKSASNVTNAIWNMRLLSRALRRRSAVFASRWSCRRTPRSSVLGSYRAAITAFVSPASGDGGSRSNSRIKSSGNTKLTTYFA